MWRWLIFSSTSSHTILLLENVLFRFSFWTFWYSCSDMSPWFIRDAPFWLLFPWTTSLLSCIFMIFSLSGIRIRLTRHFIQGSRGKFRWKSQVWIWRNGKPSSAPNFAYFVWFYILLLSKNALFESWKLSQRFLVNPKPLNWNI